MLKEDGRMEKRRLWCEEGKGKPMYESSDFTLALSASLRSKMVRAIKTTVDRFRFDKTRRMFIGRLVKRERMKMIDFAFSSH
jgi:hypothetical protein